MGFHEFDAHGSAVSPGCVRGGNSFVFPLNCYEVVHRYYNQTFIARGNAMPKERFAFILKIELLDIKPPIWRRIGVVSDIKLDKLHQVIQEAMGWMNCHLHEFRIGNVSYGEPTGDDFFDTERIEESTVRLDDLVAKGSKFIYNYDFGDDWRHSIKVEKVETLDVEPLSDAWLLAGGRACPPEDVGGPWGYSEFLETIRNPESPEAQDMLEWVGGGFDPEEFDIEDAKTAVLKVSKRRKRKA
jgi:hypothetical protein